MIGSAAIVVPSPQQGKAAHVDAGGGAKPGSAPASDRNGPRPEDRSADFVMLLDGGTLTDLEEPAEGPAKASASSGSGLPMIEGVAEAAFAAVKVAVGAALSAEAGVAPAGEAARGGIPTNMPQPTPDAPIADAPVQSAPQGLTGTKPSLAGPADVDAAAMGQSLSDGNRAVLSDPTIRTVAVPAAQIANAAAPSEGEAATWMQAASRLGSGATALHTTTADGTRAPLSQTVAGDDETPFQPAPEIPEQGRPTPEHARSKSAVIADPSTTNLRTMDQTGLGSASETRAMPPTPAQPDRSPPVAAAPSVASPKSPLPATTGRATESSVEPALLAPREAASALRDMSAALTSPMQADRPPPNAPAIIRQIGITLPTGDSNSIEVRLDPAELGRVTVTMSITDDGLRATISAERPEIGEMLRRHADLLQREFQAAGHRTVTMDFGPSGNGASGQGTSGEDSTRDTSNPTDRQAGSDAPSLMATAPATTPTGQRPLDLRL